MASTSVPTHAHTTRCWWHPLEARWVCNGDRSAEPETPVVDVRDMLVVHTAILREFRLAPDAVARVREGDLRAARTVDGHLEFLCELLHHHHQGEDDLLWPLLRTRVPASALALLDEVDGQHAGIDACLHAVADARSDWVHEPQRTSQDRLVGALEELYAKLKAHLELEEAKVLPLAAGVLTQAEWNVVGEAAAAAMPKPDLLLAFGMFAYEGDPDVLRSMLASAPAVPRFVVPRIGPRVYARRARAVHSTARP